MRAMTMMMTMAVMTVAVAPVIMPGMIVIVFPFAVRMRLMRMAVVIVGVRHGRRLCSNSLVLHLAELALLFAGRVEVLGIEPGIIRSLQGRPLAV